MPGVLPRGLFFHGSTAVIRKLFLVLSRMEFGHFRDLFIQMYGINYKDGIGFVCYLVQTTWAFVSDQQHMLLVCVNMYQITVLALCTKMCVFNYLQRSGANMGMNVQECICSHTCLCVLGGYVCLNAIAHTTCVFVFCSSGSAPVFHSLSQLPHKARSESELPCVE